MTKSRDAFRTISEVAEWLDVPPHVLRFWESRFTQVKPVKRAGGRRYYRPTDMELLGGIKKLLHDDGVTIKGVQKLLREHGIAHVSRFSPPLETDANTPPPAVEAEASEVTLEVVEAEPVVDNVISFRHVEPSDDRQPQLDLVPPSHVQEKPEQTADVAAAPDPEPAETESAEPLSDEPAPSIPEVSVPDDPEDDAIMAKGRMICILAALHDRDLSAKTAEITPLVARLETLQNRMTQTRGN